MGSGAQALTQFPCFMNILSYLLLLQRFSSPGPLFRPPLIHLGLHSTFRLGLPVVTIRQALSLFRKGQNAIKKQNSRFRFPQFDRYNKMLQAAKADISFQSTRQNPSHIMTLMSLFFSIFVHLFSFFKHTKDLALHDQVFNTLKTMGETISRIGYDFPHIQMVEFLLVPFFLFLFFSFFFCVLTGALSLSQFTIIIEHLVTNSYMSSHCTAKIMK